MKISRRLILKKPIEIPNKNVAIITFCCPHCKMVVAVKHKGVGDFICPACKKQRGNNYAKS